MKLLFVMVVISVFSLATGATGESPDLLLQGECGSTEPCIPMLLNYGRLGEKVLVSAKSLHGGYSEFTLQVHGRLAGAEPGTYLLAVRGYTDGMKCCDFGQAKGAVLGYAGSGKPILLTTRGPLVLTDDSLEVGCSTCIKVTDVSSGRTIATYSSPSWDLNLTGHHKTDFSLGPSGELFLLQAGACVQVLPNALFKVVDRGRCTGKAPQKLTLTIEEGACT